MTKYWPGSSKYILYVHSYFPLTFSFGDHYEWNKVTSCIHNILSGQRWIEHYGEISIKNSNSEKCQCKVTFIKVSCLCFLSILRTNWNVLFSHIRKVSLHSCMGPVVIVIQICHVSPSNILHTCWSHVT